jgi:hypothetical protein
MGQTATDLKNKAKDTATGLTDKARDVASSVAEQARDTASHLGERASEAASSVGGGIRNLAGTLREQGPHEGMMGSATSTVARALDNSGRYLQEHDLSAISGDLANVIRRNPIGALFVGIGIGYLIARATSRS